MKKTGLLHYKIRKKQFNIFETDMELKKTWKNPLFYETPYFFYNIYIGRKTKIF